MGRKSIVVILCMIIIIMLCAFLVYGQSALVLAADQSITRDGDVMEREKAGRTTRFTDNGNGTVTDNDTGLLWLKDANCFDSKDWPTAMSIAANLTTGYCGLLDGSAGGDWRLPTIDEWDMLVDPSQNDPALPSDYPFTNVQSDCYWSSSTITNDTSDAWVVFMPDGSVYEYGKADIYYYVWPVRSGQ